MNDEFISLLVEGSSRLNATDERTMSQLSLGVRADNLPRLSERNPICNLFICALQFDEWDEQKMGKAKRIGVSQDAEVAGVVESVAVVINAVFERDFSSPKALKE